MTMLAAGVMPDANTLTTAGISASEAAAIRLAALGGVGGSTSTSSRSSSSSSTGKSTSKTNTGENQPSRDLNDLSSFDTDEFTNSHGADTVRVDGENGSVSYMTWSSADKYVKNGSVKIVNNGDGTYTLVMA